MADRSSPMGDGDGVLSSSLSLPATDYRSDLRRAFFQGLRRWHEIRVPAHCQIEESSTAASSFLSHILPHDTVEDRSPSTDSAMPAGPEARWSSANSWQSESSIHESDLRDIVALCEANKAHVVPPPRPVTDANFGSNAYFRALREVQQRLHPSC